MITDSITTTATSSTMITVFLKDRSKDIPFDVKEHDTLEHLNYSICQSFKALKYQKNVKLNVQMKNVCDELINISSDESWKILFNELLKNNSITLYVEKERKFKEEDELKKKEKKTKLTDEEKELKKKEKKEKREQEKLLRKQELSKEIIISEESIELKEEEENESRKQKDCKTKEERKKERELKKSEKKELREKKKQQSKEEQSITESELNEMKRIYLDGNNMMYVTKVLRDLSLKRKNRKLAEQLLIKISKLFKEHEVKDYVHICFDSTSDLSLIENDKNTFIVSSAKKEGFNIADDYLVELADKEVNNHDTCLFVTCDRELRVRLTEKGVKCAGTSTWLKLAHSKLCENTEAMDIDAWMSKLLEEM